MSRPNAERIDRLVVILLQTLKLREPLCWGPLAWLHRIAKPSLR